MERDDVFYQAKNRARNALIRARERGVKPTPDEHAEMIEVIRCHTGASSHVAAGAYHEALAELVEELDRCS